MARPIKWTEKKIQSLEAAGHGRGLGKDYVPWLSVTDVSSLGRSRRVFSHKTGRTHELLSDVEYRLFLVLEWLTDVVDIREQYPLNREMTLTIAQQLGLRHPYYPGTQVATVMTVDFFVTRMVAGTKSFMALNAKRDEEASDENSMLKLEIQREFFESNDVPHHAIFHSQIPRQKADNIDWIRSALVKPSEVEPRPGFFSGLTARMATELSQSSFDQATPLSEYCLTFDERHGLEQGIGLRVAQMLMHERVLRVDLSAPNLAAEPLSAFVMTAQRGKLRAVGGTR
jgi:hypothetical protein